MIASRFALYLDLLLLFGLPLFRLHALDREQRQAPEAPSFAHATVLLAGCGLIIAALNFALLCAEMTGTSLSSLDVASVKVILSETATGSAWTVRMTALLITLILAIACRRSRDGRAVAALAVTSAAALASLAWSGHGAAGEGTAGAVQLASDIIHLLAAGVWIGALTAFILLVCSQEIRHSSAKQQLAANGLERFAVTGTIVVAAITLTGVVNSLMLIGIGNVPHLGATLYGRLLVAKLILFGGMLALAAANRFRLTPRLLRRIGHVDTTSAISALRRSLAMEAGAGALILGLVAWLGTLEPPVAAN